MPPCACFSLGVARPYCTLGWPGEGSSVRWVGVGRFLAVGQCWGKEHTPGNTHTSGSWFSLLGEQWLYLNHWELNRVYGVSVQHWPGLGSWRCLMCMKRNERCCWTCLRCYQLRSEAKVGAPGYICAGHADPGKRSSDPFLLVSGQDSWDLDSHTPAPGLLLHIPPLPDPIEWCSYKP